jgi:hypothetical protein
MVINNFNLLYFFPLIIAFYFFYIQKKEFRLEWINDLTDYLICNDDFFLLINKEEEKEEEEKEEEEKEIKETGIKETGIKEKEPPKYEEKYIDNFYINNNDTNLCIEEETQKEIYIQDEKKIIENNRMNINLKLDYWYNEKKNSLSEDFKKEIQSNIEIFEKKKEILVLKEEKLEEQAIQFILSKRLEKLKNSFIMEKTPLGNVVMYYNVKRESFEYFSDSTIPYRFLEVVARKYVSTFKCRFIYVLMEEELKKYEKKVELFEIQKKIKEEEDNKTNSLLPNKKNVFATFKSYNKESGSGRVIKAPPPKNSIPNNSFTKNQKDKIILKENANRYTYEGRFSNFSPLKKVERKEVDKKYCLSFADFKKLHLQS